MPGLKRTSTYLTPGGAKKARTGRKETTAISASIPRGINLRKQVLAQSMRTTLRYTKAGNIVASGTGATPAWTVMRMSVFDPEYALGGTQPRGFNQMESLYNDYIIESVSVEVRYVNGGVAHRPYVFICARSDPSAAIDWRDINENPDRVISKKTLSRLGEGSAMESQHLQMTCVPRKLLGITDPTDSRLVTAVTTNPEADYYFLIGACDPYATSGSVTVGVSVTLTYNVKFVNPKSLNASA